MADELKPPLSRLDPPSDQPAWEQIVALFERHGMPEPPWRLRDKLVMMFAWGHYGMALHDAKTVAPPPPQISEEMASGALKRVTAYITARDFMNTGVMDFVDDHPTGSSDGDPTVTLSLSDLRTITAALSLPRPADGALGRHVEVVQPIRERPISSFDKGEEPSAWVVEHEDFAKLVWSKGQAQDQIKLWGGGAFFPLYTRPSTGVSREEVKAALNAVRTDDDERYGNVVNGTVDDCEKAILALIARGAA